MLPDLRFHFARLPYDRGGRDYRENFPFLLHFVLAKIIFIPQNLQAYYKLDQVNNLAWSSVLQIGCGQY